MCSLTTTAVTFISGVVVSAISTAIVTSIIVWCVMRKPARDQRRAAQRLSSPAGAGVTTHELAPAAIYDTPVFQEHDDQSAINTQDNIAMEGQYLSNRIRLMDKYTIPDYTLIQTHTYYFHIPQVQFTSQTVNQAVYGKL